MKKHLNVLALVVGSCLATHSAQSAVYGSGTGNPNFPDIIDSTDPSLFESIEYLGIQTRPVYDRRTNYYGPTDMYVFESTFAEGKTVVVSVNMEFGSIAAAQQEAVFNSTVLGQMPVGLRTELYEVWIHAGNAQAGAGNGNLTWHTGAIYNYYIPNGVFEEIYLHECVHIALDPHYKNDPAWLQAQIDDPDFLSVYGQNNPTTEDMAETFRAHIASNYVSDRIPEADLNLIRTNVPNRIDFFDRLEIEMYPLIPSQGDTGLTGDITIEAEDFNLNGYYDTSEINHGGAYRDTRVDIGSDGQNGYFVGWISSGEFLEYTVDVHVSAAYDFAFNVATAQTIDKTFHIEIDGQDVSGPITFNTSGAGWQTWQTVTVSDIFLSEGIQTLRIVMDDAGFNIDYFTLSKVNELDLYTEAANYNAESDPTIPGRISPIGTIVGYVQDGTWVRYDGYDFGTGASSIDLSVSKGNTTAASIEVRLNAEDGLLLATIPVTDTGGFSIFETITANFNAPVAGIHDLYFVFTGGSGFLLDVASFIVNQYDELDLSVAGASFDSESDPTIPSRISPIGSVVGYVQGDTWVSYDSFAFGAEAKSINLSLSKGSLTTAFAEIRLDAFDGPLLATIFVNPTGSFLNFETFSANFSTPVSDIHDLYVVFKGGAGFLMDLGSFTVNSVTSASTATFTATASSEDGALSASNAVDGYRNHNTFWRSLATLPQTPQEITLELDGTYTVSGLTYLPWLNFSNWGAITDYEIYTSIDGVNFNMVTSGTWPGNNSRQTASFPSTSATHVRLKAIGSTSSKASAADISLF